MDPQRKNKTRGSLLRISGISFFRLGKVNESEEKKAGCCELIIATGKQMRRKKQLLLIPLTIWSGLEQGFFGADFTAVSNISDISQVC